MPATDRAYIAAACRNAGIVEFWLDEAIDDVIAALWIEQVPEPMVKVAIHRRAIDAARRYGSHSRNGVSHATVSIHRFIGDEFVSEGHPGAIGAARHGPKYVPLALRLPDHGPRIAAYRARLAAVAEVWRAATANQRACFIRALKGTTSKDHTAHTHAKNLRQKMRALAA